MADRRIAARSCARDGPTGAAEALLLSVVNPSRNKDGGLVHDFPRAVGDRHHCAIPDRGCRRVVFQRRADMVHAAETTGPAGRAARGAAGRHPSSAPVATRGVSTRDFRRTPASGTLR